MTGTQLGTGLTAAAAVLVLLVLFGTLSRSPKVAVTAWLFVVCFVPVWIGQELGAYFPAFTILSLLTALSLLPAATRMRWTLADFLVLAVAAIVVVEYALDLTTRSATFDLLTTWGPAFVFGRLVTTVLDPRWIYGAFGVLFSIVAVLALVEFASSLNPFTTLLANDTYNFETWGRLQPRGGVTRAEGAFGHSIALGCSLAVAVALTLGSRFRPWIRTAMVAGMVGAAVVGFSRAGMVTAGTALLLSCLFLREPLSRRYRVLVLLLALAAAAAVFLAVRDVFLSSGDEAEGSALYRTELLQLVPFVQPFGLATDFTVSTTQEVSVGGFASIDNALLLFALVYGWVPLALLLLLLPAAVYVLLRGRATPPLIAVLAQLPALLTVALITQYAAVWWFALGMAVSTQALANVARGGPVAAPLPRLSSPTPSGRLAGSHH